MHFFLTPRSLEPPVLVWTVGKVASSSINATLKEAGIETIHVHYLSDEHLTHQINSTYRGTVIPLHTITSLRFRHNYDRDLFKVPLRIVTLVRDPLARNISAYFENLKHFSKGLAPAEAEPEAHVRNFLDHYPHDIVFDWFDDEVLRVTGIDHRAIGFDPEQGWCIHRTEKFEVLVLRAENSDAEKLVALSTFFGRSFERLVRANEGIAKSYKQLYQEFKEALTLPRDHVDRMYDHPFCTTFWSPTEIERMRRSWRTCTRTVPTRPSTSSAVGYQRVRSATGQLPSALRIGLRGIEIGGVLMNVKSEWSVSGDGFDRLAQLQVTGLLKEAMLEPKFSVELFDNHGQLLTAFAPRAPAPSLRPGDFFFSVEIADLQLNAGVYYTVLKANDAATGIACAAVLESLVLSGSTSQGVLAPAYRCTLDQCTDTSMRPSE